MGATWLIRSNQTCFVRKNTHKTVVCMISIQFHFHCSTCVQRNHHKKGITFTKQVSSARPQRSSALRQFCKDHTQTNTGSCRNFYKHNRTHPQQIFFHDSTQYFTSSTTNNNISDVDTRCDQQPWRSTGLPMVHPPMLLEGWGLSANFKTDGIFC